MWTELLIGISLLFIFEGLVLAAFPEMLKQAIQEALKMPVSKLRAIGIASMLFGLAILLIFN